MSTPTSPRQRSRKGTQVSPGISGKRGQEILNAAAELFHRQGYASTSLQEIGDAVGLLKGSLYHYIRSKEDLLYAIVREVHDGAHQNMQATDAVEGNALERLEVFVAGHVTRMANNVTHVRVFYTDFTRLGTKRRREILRYRREYEEYLTDLLVAGQQDGLIRAEIEVTTYTMAILTMLNSFYVWYDSGGSITPEDLARSYADFVLHGVSVTPGNGQLPGR